MQHGDSSVAIPARNDLRSLHSITLVPSFIDGMAAVSLLALIAIVLSLGQLATEDQACPLLEDPPTFKINCQIPVDGVRHGRPPEGEMLVEATISADFWASLPE